VLGYVVVRLLASLAMAVAATLVVFLVAHTVPADPTLAQLGERAAANPELVARYRAKWGLDQPLWVQYGVFLKGLAHGDLGASIVSRRPVLDDIADYAPATFELATVAALIVLVIGVPLGVAAAIRRDSWIDHVARLLSLIGVSAPTFWLAFVALVVFYGALHIAPAPGRLGLADLPPPNITGMYLVDSVIAGDSKTFTTALAHIMLPAMVLAASTVGLITRTTRASMLDVLGQEYIRVAIAKGLPRRQVILRHALRNALIPVVTLGGVAYAELLAGAVLTETIFSWPGLGRFTFDSAVALDFPALMGVSLVVAIIFLIVNLVVDLSYAFIDPRVVAK
jgi:peptide/nickel transport system permease protein